MQDAINTFFKRLKYYCLRETKEWKVSVCALRWVHSCNLLS
jgi:hypothetical protein